MVHRTSSLADDPEFSRLTPNLAHISTASSNINAMNHVLVEALRSYGALPAWAWILSAPDARTLLDGCPDPDRMPINPFYSTRTFVGCEDKKLALAAEATSARGGTQVPENYADLPVTYPPDGSPYPLIGWQAAPQGGGFPPFTVYDFLPRV